MARTLVPALPGPRHLLHTPHQPRSMSSRAGIPQLEELATVEHTPGSPVDSIDEKAEVKGSLEKLGSTDSDESVNKVEGGKTVYDDDGEEVRLVNGEPVITTGRDVSRFLIDTRDDGDPAITFRSLFIGTVFAGLGAALCQVRPVYSLCLRHRWRYLRSKHRFLTSTSSYRSTYSSPCR